MPDTVLGGYSCPCGWKGNSRQALHWHRTNSCKLREQPEAPQEPAKAPQIAEVAPAEPAAVVQEKPARVALATARPRPEPEPDDEPEDEEPETKADDDDKFEVLLVPIVLVVLLIAGIIVFREKIVELFERMRGGNTPPPSYGVPNYG